MHLSDLEVLVCLAEEGSFSRVAGKLHRSQPAVSQALRRLEEAFQVQLLDRTSRRAVLTGAGRSVVDYAGRILKIWDGALKVMEERRMGSKGVLRLTGNGFLCDYLVPELIEAFRREYPAAMIEVVHCPASGIPSLLLDQDLDFGFLSYAPGHRDLESRILFRDDLVLAVPASHPLATSSSVPLRQLGGLTFVAHAARTPSRKRLDYLFGQEGIKLQVALELPGLEAIKRFVTSGAGVTILPRLCLGRELGEGLLVSPPIKATPIGRDIRVAFRRSRARSPLADAFLDLLARRYPCQAD